MASKFSGNYFPEILALSMGRSKPSMVTVNLTKRCNQRCIYCEIGQSPSSGHKDLLTTDDLKWIIDEMSANKIKKISLCGGEPFLFDGIADIVAYAGKKNIRCSITSNGMTVHALSQSDLDTLIRYKTEINISIDSFREEIQTLTRGTPGALSNALKSIQLLSEKHIPVTVLAVISKHNYHDLYHFFTTAYEKGVKQVLFQPVIYYSNYPERKAVDKKSLLNVGVAELKPLMDQLSKILEFEKRHPISTNVYRIYPWISQYLQTASNQGEKWFFEAVLKKFHCREVYAIVDISYDGGIQPCGLTAASVSIHKNRHEGLIPLWLKATAGIRKDMTDGNYYDCCNGCCHHFSRNMLASIFKYPITNRAALFTMIPLLLSRIQSRIRKKLHL
ncbi:MAG: radical SAM protein [Lentimicrobium sp.]|nr:radical SAM protein [Lentimicrobium sp.]